MELKNKISKKNQIFSLLLCIFVIIFDQATKWSILAFLPQGSTINICPFLNLVLTFNFGTSFGLLSPSTIIEYYMIIALSVLCIIFLIYVFIKLKNTIEQILCSLLIGGAIGNLIDRFFHGAVVDFIDIYYNNWHWPAFNMADSFISCSAIGLLIYNLFSNEKRK